MAFDFNIFKKATQKVNDNAQKTNTKEKEKEKKTWIKIDIKAAQDIKLLHSLITEFTTGVVPQIPREHTYRAKMVFVKPGMYDDKLGISNIDVVQAIYATHGIQLEKSICDKTDVLSIDFAELNKLDDEAEKFFVYSVPDPDRETSRATEIIKKILHDRKVMPISKER